MSTATEQTVFQRDLMPTDEQVTVANLLQDNLINLIDLSLTLKQAHWNLVGRHFRSLHLHLDEIIEISRGGSDEVAERIAALGVPADGRSKTVARNSQLDEYPETFQTVEKSVTCVADALHKTTSELRKAIKRLGELDPISEDLCIGLCGSLEKQLWMIQSQEINQTA